MTNGAFRDDKRFWPIWERAAKLDVPMYPGSIKLTVPIRISTAVSGQATRLKALRMGYGWEDQKGRWLGRNGLAMGFCAIVLLGAGLRAYALDFQSLWTDEIFSLMITDPTLPFRQFLDMAGLPFSLHYQRASDLDRKAFGRGFN